MQVFRIVTLEGWSAQMYTFMDSTGVSASLFFTLVVVIGSFFLLNLFLAVIMETFIEISELEKDK